MNSRDKPLYHIERKIEELDEPFDDGKHIIYVNGAAKDASTALGRSMHDMFCIDPDDMHYKELADKVRYLKEEEEGDDSMCKVMEDMRKETADKATEIARLHDIKILMDNLKFVYRSGYECIEHTGEPA